MNSAITTSLIGKGTDITRKTLLTSLLQALGHLKTSASEEDRLSKELEHEYRAIDNRRLIKLECYSRAHVKYRLFLDQILKDEIRLKEERTFAGGAGECAFVLLAREGIDEPLRCFFLVRDDISHDPIHTDLFPIEIRSKFSALGRVLWNSVPGMLVNVYDEVIDQYLEYQVIGVI